VHKPVTSEDLICRSLFLRKSVAKFALAGLLARSSFNAFPFFFEQWLLSKLLLELTAAGTAPDFHWIPF